MALRCFLEAQGSELSQSIDALYRHVEAIMESTVGMVSPPRHAWGLPQDRLSQHLLDLNVSMRREQPAGSHSKLVA